jgi:hypothetical protein
LEHCKHDLALFNLAIDSKLQAHHQLVASGQLNLRRSVPKKSSPQRVAERAPQTAVLLLEQAEIIDRR